MSTVYCQHCNKLTPFPNVDVGGIIIDMIMHCKDEYHDELLIKYGYNPDELLKKGKMAIKRAFKEVEDRKRAPLSKR